ncbi:hypothetical protein [Caballeronia insecticola]|uniref:Isochorismatase family hydrolase n=1 Tax=Caballeronia insecticola TaxID=758793 RepID=A0A060PH98_9BURK|nr:hypothetical protein [Caballeronia insecticola]BAO94157.1 isochorismatase family hydrolase [Caballeronia insecticola]
MSLGVEAIAEQADNYGLKRDAYDVRPIRFIELESAHGWTFKFYGINARYVEGEPIVDAGLLNAAKKLVWDQVANNPLLSKNSHRTGFAVLHQGRLGNWLLLDWWSHDVLWKQILFRSESITNPEFTKDPNAVVACTWEIPLIAFEREHWVRNVQRIGHGVSAETAVNRYLQEHFNGDI